MNKLIAALLFASLSSFTAYTQTTPPLSLTRSITLQGVTGKFDHFTYDLAGNRLFIAATGNHSVEVLNVVTGTVTESITGLGKPHGLAWIPESGRLFVSDGTLASLNVYEGSPFKLIGTIKLSADADDMVYDESTHLLYVGHGGSDAANPGRVAVVDTKTLSLTANLPASTHPEALDIDVAGKRIFANIADSAEVAVIDGGSHKLALLWKLSRAKDNVPLAYDAEDGLLLIGCRTPAKLVALDAKTGHQVTEADSAAGADDLFYDAQTHCAYLISGSGEVNVYRISAAHSLVALGATKTGPGAKTGLLVPSQQTLYVGLPGTNGGAAHINLYSTKSTQ